ncbi:MAG: hypothetical protein WC554_05610 [Clostridia bacterium]
MKKVSSFLLATVLVLPVLVMAQSENASVNASTEPAQNEVSTQTATQNAGEESQLQVNVATQAGEEVGEQQYQPKSETAGSRSSEVAKAVQSMVEVANRVNNPSVGEQIRDIARAQNEAEDSANKALDKVQERSGFVKFLIGSNFAQIKEVKKIMEQNQVRVRELQQIMLQLDNEADQTELQNQINVLEIQNLNLANQLDEMDGGFTLFGWLVRWFYGL